MPWLLYIFSDFLRFVMSLLLLTVTLRGVSNKHCLLSLFFIEIIFCFVDMSDLVHDVEAIHDLC